MKLQNNLNINFKAVYTGGKIPDGKRSTAQNIQHIRPEGRKDVVDGLNNLNAQLSKFAANEDYMIYFTRIPLTFFDDNETAVVTVTDASGTCVASAKTSLREEWGAQLIEGDLKKAIKTLFDDVSLSLQKYLKAAGKSETVEKEVKDILDELI